MYKIKVEEFHLWISEVPGRNLVPGARTHVHVCRYLFLPVVFVYLQNHVALSYSNVFYSIVTRNGNIWVYSLGSLAFNFFPKRMVNIAIANFETRNPLSSTDWD
jgi:hypothetical protein